MERTKNKLFCITALSLLFLGGISLAMLPSGNEEASGIEIPNAEANTA